jgi:hypothetical protein
MLFFISKKEIENKLKSDEEIIEKLKQEFLNNKQNVVGIQYLRDVKFDANEMTLLHLAAKNNRPSLCRFLIKTVQISKII